MSKKTFMKVDMKEVLCLLLVDLFILSSIALYSISGCFSAKGVIIVNQNLACPLQFLLNLQNILFVVAVAFVANLAISGVWHFVVRKK